MSKPHVEVVAALIYDANGRLLITQRHDHAHLGGYWEFPGGTIEPGEKPEDALVREIREEVNLVIQVQKLFWREQAQYDTKSVDIRFYLCEMTPPGQSVTPLDVADFRWVAPELLHAFTFPGADLRLVELLQTGGVQ